MNKIFAEPANVCYPDQINDYSYIYEIVSGDLLLITNFNHVQKYSIGQKFIIPANTIYAIRFGEKGCRFISYPITK